MKKELVLITGISGAGKTTASGILEDMGYVCIDRYPSELLDDFVELLLKDESFKYQKVALTVDINEFEKYRYLLEHPLLNTILILMDASEEEIIRRYKFTRRIHPLMVSNKVETLANAVQYEKKLLAEYLPYTSHIIDTTKMSVKSQKTFLDSILHYDHHDNFSVSFVSFGYKKGVPEDADFIFDARVLENPFYVPELKNKTGNDLEVYNYVMNQDKTKVYLKALIKYLDICFDSYQNGEKRHITVAIGCTGGQHRSVTLTNFLYNYYSKNILCFKRNREIDE